MRAGVGLGLAAVLAFAVPAVLIRMSDFDEGFRNGTARATCTITGCGPGAMAFVGWLLPIILLGYAITLWLGLRHWSTLTRICWLLGGFGLFLAGVPFFPSPGGPALTAMIDAPNGVDFADGLRWGAWTAVAAVIMIGAGRVLTRLRISERADAVLGFAAFILVLVSGSGVGSIATVEGNELTTTRLFPEQQVRVGDDVLTWSSGTDFDFDGCRDDFPNCLRALEFDFTTTDSDAVVHFQVVQFIDEWRAQGAADDLADDTGDPASLRVKNVTNRWLVISTVRHADGRAIADDERKWLRWPAAELDYAFRRSVRYNVGKAPTPSDTIAPKS
ncbi:hypothetical protein Ahu01nite_030870 [Winogradskya humida]|uniref:Uncharacterized protein n=1 Tax=Winogradskya humida TaxID=113566 RepID=A0ABQ3ZN21_9ACTN|nr:hypothetical protein Ahu01nite_030870 [Actinoplanes humidus]